MSLFMSFQVTLSPSILCHVTVSSHIMSRHRDLYFWVIIVSFFGHAFTVQSLADIAGVQVSSGRWAFGIIPSLTADVVRTSAIHCLDRLISKMAYCVSSGMYEGVQKVRRPTQLTMRCPHHILSLFDIFSCNCIALGPAFLQSSDSIVEELLFLVF